MPGATGGGGGVGSAHGQAHGSMVSMVGGAPGGGNGNGGGSGAPRDSREGGGGGGAGGMYMQQPAQGGQRAMHDSLPYNPAAPDVLTGVGNKGAGRFVCAFDASGLGKPFLAESWVVSFRVGFHPRREMSTFLCPIVEKC